VLRVRPRVVIWLLLCGAVVPGVALGALAVPAGSWRADADVSHAEELDAGFHLLYELRLEEARNHFEAWQKSHPEDPLGSASEAASYLFEECYRQGVLSSEFFLDNNRFLGKILLKPDPKLRAAFFGAVKQAQDLAQFRLKTTPDDANALFAMTLSLGMQTDYASLIDQHQLDSLKMIREADKYAKKLLVVAPDAADAYLGLGTANYVIGSLSGLKRLFVGLAGIHGDKKVGIQQLEIAADHGHYLRPFAKILLALVALREKKTEVARTQLKELVAEFPENPLFASELAKLNVPPGRGHPPRKVNSSWAECASAVSWCLERHGTARSNLRGATKETAAGQGFGPARSSKRGSATSHERPCVPRQATRWLPHSWTERRAKRRGVSRRSRFPRGCFSPAWRGSKLT